MRELMCIFSDVALEIESAMAKHPGNVGLYEALAEEVCELGRAFYEEPGSVEREAIQVMCVACRIIREGTTPPSGGVLIQVEMLESMAWKRLKQLGAD